MIVLICFLVNVCFSIIFDSNVESGMSNLEMVWYSGFLSVRIVSNAYVSLNKLNIGSNSVVCGNFFVCFVVVVICLFFFVCNCVIRMFVFVFVVLFV